MSYFTAIACCLLQTGFGLAEVGPDHAGVGPGRRLAGELHQQLDAVLNEQRARLLQPLGLTAVPRWVQQEALDLDVCRTGGHRPDQFQSIITSCWSN